MNKKTELKNYLIELLQQNQLATQMYKRLGLKISDTSLSQWFILFGEQKEIFANQLANEIRKLGKTSSRFSHPFSFNKNKEIEPKLINPERLKNSTKEQELSILQKYNEVITNNDFPDSITLTLLRQRDQISLALRYLDKIAA